MFKKEDLDQSGFLFSKKDDACGSSSSSAQQPHAGSKTPDFKLWVSDLLAIKKSLNHVSADFYNFRGLNVTTVNIYGVVTLVDSNRFGVLYKVDDGTGEIDCWHDRRRKPNKENLRRKVETIMSAIQQSSFDEATDIDEPSTSSANYHTTTKSPKLQVAEWLKNQILSASECKKDTYDLGNTVQVRGKLVDFRGDRCIRIYNIREVFDVNEETNRRYELQHLYKTCYSQKEQSNSTNLLS